MNRIRWIITELHRRSLWQVLGIYIAASWVALEVTGEMVDRFGLPDWFPAFALALLIVGLPVVLATAFVQEGGPIRRDEATAPRATPDATTTASGGEERVQGLLTWRNAIAGGISAFALWGVIATGSLLLGGSARVGADDSGSAARASIAVLPFENLSADEDNAYFADGVHEEILTRLAGVPSLKVISRTSVMEYRDTQKNLREIARELGVAHILEGSVRRAGDQVRITAQLIAAETDEHVWAESYDRGLSDIFAIQADVATKIADALHAQLDPRQREELEQRPTESLEAWDDFLRAREIENRGRRPETVAAAQRLYERAIERDPDFIEARARLAWSHLLTYWLGIDRSPARVDRAREQIDQLQVLAPDAAATHFALGFLRYYGEYDFAAAVDEFRAALADMPHDARAGLAYAQRRLGQWDEHIDNLERARELNPRDQDPLRNLGESYAIVGRLDDAIAAYEGAIELSPTFPEAHEQLVRTYYRAGRLDDAAEALEYAESLELGSQLIDTRVELAILRGDEAAALAAIEDMSGPFFVAQLPYVPAALLRAEVFSAFGRASEAASSYDEALRRLEPVAAERPWDPRVWLAIAQARGGLGRRDAAHDAMRRVRELYPVDRDHLLGPAYRVRFARIHVRLGEHDEAIALLRGVLAQPAAFTREELRLDPVWRPLHGDRRFQALLRGG